MIFTTVEQAFLDHHKIPASKVLSAAGLNRQEVLLEMESGDFTVAIDVPPCQKSGHRIRLKSWHCVQCYPANLGFRGNYHRAGSVYVCVSDKKNLTKIGSSSQSPEDRVNKLNKVRYGGATDWRLEYSCAFEEAGLVEFAAQKSLRKFRAQGVYGGQNRVGECGELFSCTAKEAIEEIGKAAKEGQPSLNSTGINHKPSNPSILAVKKRDVDFRDGVKVRHVKALHWGDGVVIGDSTKDIVVVRFQDGQQRVFEVSLTFLVRI